MATVRQRVAPIIADDHRRAAATEATCVYRPDRRRGRRPGRRRAALPALLADPRLEHFFAGVDLDALEAHQRAFIAAALGGPQLFGGRDMAAAHAGRDILTAASTPSSRTSPPPWPTWARPCRTEITAIAATLARLRGRDRHRGRARRLTRSGFAAGAAGRARRCPAAPWTTSSAPIRRSLACAPGVPNIERTTGPHGPRLVSRPAGVRPARGRRGPRREGGTDDAVTVPVRTGRPQLVGLFFGAATDAPPHDQSIKFEKLRRSGGTQGHPGPEPSSCGRNAHWMPVCGAKGTRQHLPIRDWVSPWAPWIAWYGLGQQRFCALPQPSGTIHGGCSPRRTAQHAGSMSTKDASP